MLFTLKAPIAYLPLSALAKRSRVCVSGIIESYSLKNLALFNKAMAREDGTQLSHVVLGQFSIQRSEADLKQLGRFFLVTPGVGQSAVQVCQLLLAQKVFEGSQWAAGGGVTRGLAGLRRDCAGRVRGLRRSEARFRKAE